MKILFGTLLGKEESFDDFYRPDESGPVFLIPGILNLPAAAGQLGLLYADR